MTRTHGPPSTAKSELEMLSTCFGLGATSVVGRGLPVAARA